jgi:hypothetical protein
VNPLTHNAAVAIVAKVYKGGRKKESGPKTKPLSKSRRKSADLKSTAGSQKNDPVLHVVFVERAVSVDVFVLAFSATPTACGSIVSCGVPPHACTAATAAFLVRKLSEGCIATLDVRRDRTIDEQLLQTFREFG